MLKLGYMKNRKRVLPDDLASAADFFEELAMESSEEKEPTLVIFFDFELETRRTSFFLFSFLIEIVILYGLGFHCFWVLYVHHHF